MDGFTCMLLMQVDEFLTNTFYSICFYLIFVSPDMLRKVVYDTYEISGGGNSWLPLIQNGRVNVHPAARLHRSSRSDE